MYAVHTLQIQSHFAMSQVKKTLSSELEGSKQTNKHCVLCCLNRWCFHNFWPWYGRSYWNSMPLACSPWSFSLVVVPGIQGYIQEQLFCADCSKFDVFQIQEKSCTCSEFSLLQECYKQKIPWCTGHITVSWMLLLVDSLTTFCCFYHFK